MPSLGEMLRRARLKQGLELDEVAAQTRIRAKFLEALEQDDFDALPGKFFVRSFAQQYGTRLGIDPDDLATALDSALPKPEPAMPAPAEIEPEFSVPPIVVEGMAGRDKRWTWPVAALILVLVGCSGLYWLWLRTQAAAVSAQATEFQEPAVTPTPAPSPTPLAALTEPSPTPPATDEAAAAQAPTATPAPSPTPVAGEPPATEVSHLRLGAPNGKVTILVTAKEDTWVQIAVDDQIITTRVLKAGESRTLSGMRNAKLRLGNAGGVEVKWNGTNIGAVGPRGQIRTVEFTPETFLIIEPPKRAPAEPETSAGQTRSLE